MTFVFVQIVQKNDLNYVKLGDNLEKFEKSHFFEKFS